MQTIEIAESYLTPVSGFEPNRGWRDPREAELRARACCEQLENGKVLWFESLPFQFPEEDRWFLLSQRWGDSRLHKNISYRPKQDVLRGVKSQTSATARRVHEIMRRYSQNAVQFLSRLLAPYAASWSLDYASFRPEAEQERKLPLRKRNDLLHVDAFPSRPTHGGRILRCFTNINPTEARIWLTSDPFRDLAGKYAAAAGLAAIAARRGAAFGTALRGLRRVFGLKTKTRSPYDMFMLRFHDFLKESPDFRRDGRKIRLEFPPGSTWICFTDSVPHAVVHGQYAVEQTLIVPVAAMLNPEKSPLRILESLAGLPLVDRIPPRRAEEIAVAA